MCKSQNILLRYIWDSWLNSLQVRPYISVCLFYVTKSEIFIPKMFLYSLQRVSYFWNRA
jgi:hypothetical protein